MTYVSSRDAEIKRLIAEAVEAYDRRQRSMLLGLCASTIRRQA